MRRALAALALLLAACDPPLTDLTSTLNVWTGWETEQGLPQNTVQTLYQTRDGHLWIGTGAGLARFDGIRFATFEGELAPHFAYGRVTKADYEALHAMHLANHLSQFG